MKKLEKLTSKPPHVAVVGSGILGLLSALFLESKGINVSIIERDAVLHNRTSSSGEGKIHLGLIYPLGDSTTREFLLRGALTFSDYIESVTSSPIDWEQITSETFTNIVMPDSLLTPDEIEGSYYRHNLEFERLVPSIGTKYVGSQISQLFTPGIQEHHITGFPCFRTQERAVNPQALRQILLSELKKRKGIVALLNHTVRGVANSSNGVSLEIQNPVEIKNMCFDAVVNCAWENQAHFIDKSLLPELNLRFKTGISIPSADVQLSRCDTATMVTGPYGDIVVHTDHVYLSWYPLARANFELSSSPTKAMSNIVKNVLQDRGLVQRQIETFQQLGFMGENIELDFSRMKVSGGYILGEGNLDIDSRQSGLHSRPDRGVIQDEGVFSPLNYKYTTAPLMAATAAAATATYLQI